MITKRLLWTGNLAQQSANNDENHVDSDNGNTNTTAKLVSEHLDFTLPVEEVDVHHEITDEDHHNTHVNGVKGPHELWRDMKYLYFIKII